MSNDQHLPHIDPRMQAAIAELQELILARYPTTTFTVGDAEDPDGLYIRAEIDVDDPDEINETFADRIIDLQIEDGLPIYVVPVRIAALRQQQREARAVPV